ncbi:MAG: helix-turn-helix transcriptional regulator [Firmicutes bacterium]|nr:helix-turn-helix transcriptional regulator [Bacillota bacterium]
MFSEKFDKLIHELNISSRELAEFMHCDKSYINRVRSGGRKLSYASRAAERMSQGVFDYALSHSLLPQLYACIGCDAGISEAKARLLLNEWLFEGYAPQEKLKKERTGKNSGKKTVGFSEKFRQINELAGLSNVRLARLMNVDPSLTSRWRSGLSQPHDEKMRDRFCSELVKRIFAQNKAEKLARLLNVPPDMPDNEEKAADALKHWFFDAKSESNTMLENLIAGFDSAALEPNIPPLSLEQAVSENVLNDKAGIYRSTDGLRTAGLRFMGNAVKNASRELWLYSDQDMQWMTGDKSFLFKLFSLMHTYLKGGGKIKIIHNIDRGFEEMTAAIKNWLPLYMTGNIVSYYSKKAGGNRFFTTIFLDIDNACIYGSYVSGSEADAEYGYYTDAERLKYYGSFFEALMSDCRELIKTEIPTERGLFAEPTSEKKGVHVIQNRLSLETMPKELLESFCADTDAKNAEFLRGEWEFRQQRFMHNLENGFVYEYIPLPDDEMLFDGKAEVDSDIRGLFYTPEYFSQHISNIIALTEKYDNYKLIILPAALLSHSRMIIGKKSVIIDRLNVPRAYFSITHPLMRAAFTVYAEDLQQQYGCSLSETIMKLRQYI